MAALANVQNRGFDSGYKLTSKEHWNIASVPYLSRECCEHWNIASVHTIPFDRQSFPAPSALNPTIALWLSKPLCQLISL